MGREAEGEWIVPWKHTFDLFEENWYRTSKPNIICLYGPIFVCEIPNWNSINKKCAVSQVLVMRTSKQANVCVYSVYQKCFIKIGMLKNSNGLGPVLFQQLYMIQSCYEFTFNGKKMQNLFIHRLTDVSIFSSAFLVFSIRNPPVCFYPFYRIRVSKNQS